MSQERRRAQRVKVDLWVEERTEDALYFQHAINLSSTGIFLDHTLAHNPGTRVNLELHLPDEEIPLRVVGEVVSRDEAQGMAVTFVSISDEDQRRLDRYLTRKSMPPPSD